jgi:hypothetical protein
MFPDEAMDPEALSKRLVIFYNQLVMACDMNFRTILNKKLMHIRCKKTTYKPT